MPGFDGFEVVRRLRSKPFIIFTTAYDEYALKAFEENSIDYLLKPIEQKRLDKAVEKLQRLFTSSKPQIDENVERLLSRLASPPLKRLQVKSGDKILLIDTDTIVYFEAKDKYTFLHTADHEHIVEPTLAELEEKLDKLTFVRIHRSTIVNINFIREMVNADECRFVQLFFQLRERRLDDMFTVGGMEECVLFILPQSAQ